MSVLLQYEFTGDRVSSLLVVYCSSVVRGVPGNGITRFTTQLQKYTTARKPKTASNPIISKFCQQTTQN